MKTFKEFNEQEELVEFTAGLKKHWKKHKQKYITGLKIAAAAAAIGAGAYAGYKSAGGSSSSDDKFRESQKTTANTIQLEIDKKKLKELEKQRSKARYNDKWDEVRKLDDEIEFLQNIIKQRELIKKQRINSIKEPR